MSRAPAEIRVWPIGTRSFPQAEQLPPNVLPRARDVAFGRSQASLGARPGLSLFAQASGDDATIVGLGYIDDTSVAAIHNEDIYVVATGSPTGPMPMSTSLDLEDGIWQSITINGSIYWADVTGNQDSFKFHLQTAEALAHGITTPPNAPSPSSAGAGTPDGTYEFKVAWYDTSRDVLSSPSASGSFTTTGAEDITVARNNGTVPDGVDSWRVYVRKSGLQAYFYQVSGNISAGTTSYTFNASDSALTALTTRAPEPGENDPPPWPAQGFAWHLSRLFGVFDQFLFWSNVGAPDNFNTANIVVVGTKDEGECKAVLSFSRGRLFIFKERAIYALDGDAPENWTINRVYKGDGVGSGGGRAVATGDGLIGFVSHNGPFVWDGVGTPQPIYRDVHRDWDVPMWANSQMAAFDPQGNRFLFTIQLSGQPYKVCSWSTAFRCWESDGWTLPEVGAALIFPNADGSPRLMLGLAEGCLAVLDETAKTDMADASSLQYANLWYEITPSTATRFFIEDAATFPVRSTGTSRVAVVDSTTGEVKFRTYTATGTTTKQIDLGATLGSVPGEGSIAIFDCPVPDFDTGAFGAEDHTRKRFLLSQIEISTDMDMKFLVWAYKEGSPTPSRHWQIVAKDNRPSEEFQDDPSATFSNAKVLWSQRVGLVARSLRLRMVPSLPATAKAPTWFLTRMGVKIARWSR